ncbi:MAG: DNA polymerase III, partial [Verrucomicrobia bacterium]|nr:DNA polymerase III [Verrucomicrobiota bacterium]
EDLEVAAHDGRLEQLPGVGAKRIGAIRDTLARRLGRIRQRPNAFVQRNDATVAELLDVDCEYRKEAARGALQKIAPRRFNPSGEAWLPVLHTTRGSRHYTALFSNTARAHELNKTQDWVVLFYDGPSGERQCTVISSEFGELQDKRIVRGREQECREYYHL